MDIDLRLEKLMASIEADRKRSEEEHERTKAEMKESRERLAEIDRILTEKFAETDRQMKETDRLSKRLSRQLGGMSHRNGAVAESYFYNTFKKTKMFGDEKYDLVRRNVRGTTKIGWRDEYDIVLYNCDSIRIVEVKYAVTTDAIAQTLKKAMTFREVFPKYKDCAIYLGLASLTFDEKVERAALDAGLAVVKQVGDTVVVQDERIKKF